MASERLAQLEALLASSPEDPFLHYGLALEHLHHGDPAEGMRRLEGITEKFPDYQAAYFQLAQALVREDEVEKARGWLEKGIVVARRVGNLHAASEMEGMLLTL